jgi:hypothetical protein
VAEITALFSLSWFDIFPNNKNGEEIQGKQLADVAQLEVQHFV